MKQLKSKNDTLFYLLLLTGSFFLLEISFFIQCNRAYFSIFILVSNKFSVPISIMPGVFYFILAQLLLHLIYSMVIYLIVELIDSLFYFSPQIKLPFLIITWITATITVLVANQFYFPNSNFSGLTSLVFFDRQIAKIALIFLTAIWCLVALITLIGVIKNRYQRPLFYFIVLLSLLMLSCIGLKLIEGGGYNDDRVKPLISAATAERPNLILIGVDSLRPDFLGYFGSDLNTPFFDTFLQHASVFSEAVTPLARTFPSWSGILTGLYPKQMNIRTDLANQDHLNLIHTLPNLLRQDGYETIFATDETRFSNITHHFGFDRIVSPPMGLNDFLLGNFNDFPLSNLIINSSLGKWLFPYSYANRPAYFVYDPNSFLNLLSTVVNKSHNKPLFLAVHFCITHYPYLWSHVDGTNLTMEARYAKSITGVDAQLKQFFVLLQQAHLLDHAIVVLLSDHGEALELPGDRITEPELFIHADHTQSIPKFYPSSMDDEKLDQSAGHGTDVLGLPQYHALLAFQFYGTDLSPRLANDYQPRTIPGVVSLIDIKPTLLDFLHLPAPESSGDSLLPLMKNDTVSAPLRHIFLESDFSPEAIRTVFPEEQKVLLEGIDLFQVNPVTARLTVKDAMLTQIIKSKQYADIYGNWMLALYPQKKDVHIPILINLSTGEWTDDLRLPFALHSPAQQMLQALSIFYGKELGKNRSIP